MKIHSYQVRITRFIALVIFLATSYSGTSLADGFVDLFDGIYTSGINITENGPGYGIEPGEHPIGFEFTLKETRGEAKYLDIVVQVLESDGSPIETNGTWQNNVFFEPYGTFTYRGTVNVAGTGGEYKIRVLGHIPDGTNLSWDWVMFPFRAIPDSRAQNDASIFVNDGFIELSSAVKVKSSKPNSAIPSATVNFSVSEIEGFSKTAKIFVSIYDSNENIVAQIALSDDVFDSLNGVSFFNSGEEKSFQYIFDKMPDGTQIPVGTYSLKAQAWIFNRISGQPRSFYFDVFDLSDVPTFFSIKSNDSASPEASVFSPNYGNFPTPGHLSSPQYLDERTLKKAIGDALLNYVVFNYDINECESAFAASYFAKESYETLQYVGNKITNAIFGITLSTITFQNIVAEVVWKSLLQFGFSDEPLSIRALNAKADSIGVLLPYIMPSFIANPATELYTDFGKSQIRNQLQVDENTYAFITNASTRTRTTVTNRYRDVLERTATKVDANIIYSPSTGYAAILFDGQCDQASKNYYTLMKIEQGQFTASVVGDFELVEY